MKRQARWLPVTGLATLSPAGMTYDELVVGLRTGSSGISRRHRFVEWTDAPLGEIDRARLASEDVAPGEHDGLLARMVCAAVRRLDADTGLFSRYAPPEIGFFFGTSTAGVEGSLEAFFAYLRDEALRPLDQFLGRRHQHGSIAALVRRTFPITGLDCTLATACSSSANAIIEGALAIAAGLVRSAVVGGFDTLSLMTILGFDALQILDHEPCRPFSRNRKGINLAEGGGFLLLEHPETCAPRRAYLSGFGASSDAYHITQPEPEGRGMEAAMRLALTSAGLPPAAIGYVNAHGTGTPLNDDAEARALGRIFHAAVPVSSTKGLHGHTLGGSGGLEACVAIAALEHQTPWRGVGGDDDLDFAGLVRHPLSEGPCRIDHVLSNSFGFGGSNVSLVFSREGDLP